MKVLILLCGLFVGLESKSTDIVQTTKGPVQGEILTTVISSIPYSSFKGIPYGESPLHYLRFKPPVEKKSWTDVLQTTVEGANCVQKDFVLQTVFTGSEDCLYLNVYTPKVELSNVKSDLPVMVWIHGGTFKAGYGNSSLYGPDFIIEEGVVLVTFNYRLGPLGFLSINHENATGNAGLKDQNLVLRWVKKNIAKFGGNPNNVTLFGQSAGGVATDFHSLSHMSDGLFQRSISMSGSPLCPWSFYTPENAEKQAFSLASKLGVVTESKEEVLKVLYETPAVELLRLTEELGSSTPPFKPTIERADLAKNEEKFLTECSLEKYKSGNFSKLPHITGFTRDETLLFAGSLKSFLEVVESTANYVKSIPSVWPIKIPLLDKVFSLAASGIEALPLGLIKQVVTETSNLMMIQGIDTKQELLRKNSHRPVYYYHFCYETDQSLHKILYNIDMDGVAHGDDFPYLFHMTVVNLPLDPNCPTFIKRKQMVRMWTNFAKYGEPTPKNQDDGLLEGVTWPESGESANYLRIGKTFSVGQRLADLKVRFYEIINNAFLPQQTGCTTSRLQSFLSLLKKPLAPLVKNFG